MTLTEKELRTLIADAGYKIASWMHNPDVCTNKLVRDTVRRMTELAVELPNSAPDK